MSKKENTPFVIDFKQPKQSNYGAASHEPLTSSSNLKKNGNDSPQLGSHISACNAASSSGSGNNNNNNNNNNKQAVMPSKSSILYCLHGQSKIEVRDHCHRQRSEGVDVGARRKLIIASGLCLFFMICEIIGGVLSNSLAIATDAAHLLTDFASFMISLFAIWIAGRPSTQRMSFGWYRAEVIGAMASVFMIWVITGILVWLAVERVVTGNYEVDATIMLITSGLAILVNVIMGFQLQHGHGGHGHSHGGPKPAKPPAAIPDPTGLAEVKTQKPQTTATTSAKPDTCPVSPSERLEDGAGELYVDDPILELPAAGLRTFSYQASTDVQDVHNEIAAIMAETAPGAHHHGGEVAQEAVNMNVRAAFIHVLGDMLQSVGVFVAALIIYFYPEWAIADPICTFVFSIIVLFTTFAILKDALLVLMEGTPNYMHYAEVLQVLEGINGVQRVHNLRIWALSINKVALSVHLAVEPGVDPKQILQQATTAVHKRYNFFETTIQIEDFTPNMETCQQCNVPVE